MEWRVVTPRGTDGQRADSPCRHRVASILALMRATLASLLLMAACSGGGKKPVKVDIDPLPDPTTRAVLAGPLCSTDICQCRATDAPADAGAGVPEDPELKRFEIHVGPAENALWVTIDDNVLYKSDQIAEGCFYVDLRSGTHPVKVQASRGGGFSAAVDIHEYGVDTQSWYDTFTFSCGVPGACTY